MRLLVLPGDGIGPEIMSATREVVAAVGQKFGVPFEISEEVVGLQSLKDRGTTFASDYLDKARAADGVIIGPLALSEYAGAAYGQPSPSMYLRKHLDLFGNIRPSRTYPGVPNKVGPFDLVIVRENTEGFYADRNMEYGTADILVTADVSIAIRRITRFCSERIAHEAFKLARQRGKHVTIIHKSNVLKVSDGLFMKVCEEVASQYPDVRVDDVLVDAMVALLVRDPSRYDVILSTNMYGDILSDLTAELSGSLGLGGSINASATHAMAQASHGSAPDLAGKNVANPFSLIISSGMLFAWQGARANDAKLTSAAAAIDKAIAGAVADGEVTRDLAGNLNTDQAGAGIAKRILAA